jgi:hypothetical protein
MRRFHDAMPDLLAIAGKGVLVTTVMLAFLAALGMLQ